MVVGVFNKPASIRLLLTRPKEAPVYLAIARKETPFLNIELIFPHPSKYPQGNTQSLEANERPLRAVSSLLCQSIPIRPRIFTRVT